MDKLKAALSGRETLHNEDEESGFVSQVCMKNVARICKWNCENPMRCTDFQVNLSSCPLNKYQALDASSLSMGTRIKGFGACFGIGVLVCILGSLTLALNPLNIKVWLTVRLQLMTILVNTLSLAFCWPLHNWKPNGYWQVRFEN